MYFSEFFTQRHKGTEAQREEEERRMKADGSFLFFLRAFVSLCLCVGFFGEGSLT
jgi:hypothetical protein